METLFRAGVNNAVSATLLAMVVAGLSRPLARRPAILHGLWLLVLLKLVTPPLYEVPIPWPVSSGPPELKTAAARTPAVDSRTSIGVPDDEFVVEWDLATEVRGNDQEETAADTSPGGWSPGDWIRPLVATWLGGTVVILIVSFRRIRRFQGLLRETRPASHREQAWLDAMASRLGLRRGPVFEWVQAKLSPMIWSLGWRPRLIIPRDLWKSLDESQRSTLIVHELAHLRRGDHRVRYFELLVTAVFWWHPLVWWVRQALRDAEEQCCDAWVIWAFPDAARSYAQTLLETIDFLDKSEKPEPLFASGFGKVHHLRRRLTMIMSESTPRRLGGWGMLGLFGLAAMMLPVNATWAQKPEEPQKVEVEVKSIENDGDGNVGLARIEADDPALSTVRLVGAIDDDQEGSVVLNLKTDDSPEVVVSGSIQEVIRRLKLMLMEIQNKPNRAESEEKLQQALHEAIAELAKVAPQVKGSVRVVNRGMTVVTDHPRKTLTSEQKAEVEKLQAQVKKLGEELLSKQKELAEVHAQLAKVQGVRSRVPLLLRVEAKPRSRASEVIRVPDEKAARKTVVVDRKVILDTEVKPGVTVDVKRVDPKPRRVEVRVGSDDRIVKGGISAYQYDVRNDKPIAAPSDQKRIEELERKLRALLDEVANLKKDQTKGAARE